MICISKVRHEKEVHKENGYDIPIRGDHPSELFL